MGSVIFKSKKSKINEKDRAIFDLKIQRDQLKKYQIKLSSRLEVEKKKAKELVHNKEIERAKLYLKKKIYVEKLIKNADNQIETVEKMIQEIDFAEIQKTVFEGLKQGNECLKKLNESIDLNVIEEINETTQLAIERNEEINRLLSNGLTTDDFSELECELSKLVDIEETDVDETINLPSVPSNPIISKHENETIPIQA